MAKKDEEPPEEEIKEEEEKEEPPKEPDPLEEKGFDSDSGLGGGGGLSLGGVFSNKKLVAGIAAFAGLTVLLLYLSSLGVF